jgi:F0F1-type ATP synthase membrane subunit c/vacuolar-type H+-ATPase subunit K
MLWVIQAVFVLAILQFVWFGEILSSRGTNKWTLWHWVMTGLALYAVVVGFLFRRRLISRSEEALAKDASDPKAIKQWQVAQIIGMSSAEAVVLYGLVVRMVLGGTLRQASFFYAVGLFLLLLWTPRMPKNAAVRIGE